MTAPARLVCVALIGAIIAILAAASREQRSCIWNTNAPAYQCGGLVR